MKTIAETRIDTANFVLRSFADTSIERRHGGFFVCWNGYRGPVSKRWATRGGQDFYATWSHKYPGGGTSMTALSQLIRWLRGQPVLPISTWRYWASEQIKLLDMQSVDALLAGGYPERTACVLCGEFPTSLDWWNLDGVSGPCCGWTTGCRQKREITQSQGDPR